MSKPSIPYSPEELKALIPFIRASFHEDVGDGDHTSLACIQPNTRGKARLLVKETGILAGQALAELIFREADPSLTVTTFITDGSPILPGDIVLEVSGNEQQILMAERLVLNCMQRMS